MLFDVAIPRSDMDFEVCNMLKMFNVLGVKISYPHNYSMPDKLTRRNKPYIIYFIGASIPARCWPADHFTGLLTHMAANYPGHDHLVLEGIKEQENSTSILEPIKHIGNTGPVTADNIDDTGIRHLAIVSVTPTVGIFYNDPFRYWPRYPIHDVVFNEKREPTVQDARLACLNILNKQT